MKSKVKITKEIMKQNMINLFINIVLVFIIVNVVQKVIFLETSHPNISDFFRSAFVLLIVVYVVNYFLNKKFFLKKSVGKTLLLIVITIFIVGLYYFYRVSLNTNFIFMSTEEGYCLFDFLVIAIAFTISVFIVIIYAIMNFFENKKMTK